MLQVGGVAGTLTLGRLIDRFSFNALALTYLAAAAAIVAIGYAGHAVGLAALAIFCAGFGIVGGQIAANALTAMFYPTAIRATGVGWALGVGRAGSIIGPLIGGALLAMQWASQPLFLAASLPALCAAAAAWALALTARPRAAAPIEARPT
jgi:AAHS family 4-hydroxybenzoate transporter-like MFS transporter